MSYSKQNFRSGDTLYASQLNAMDDEIAALEAEVESTKNMVGSPLTASTAAGMTDQTKIYVYTGTETGYTAGHWYYYNGTAWTDGGVYNSVAVNTDTSLTVSGQAADSKAVGDAIDDLDSDLSDVKSDLNDKFDAIVTADECPNMFDKTDIAAEDTFINQNGVIGSLSGALLYYIPLRGVGDYSQKNSSIQGTYKARIFLCNASKTFLYYKTGTVDSNVTHYTITQEDLNAGAKYIAYSYKTTEISDAMIVQSATYPSAYIEYYDTTYTFNGTVPLNNVDGLEDYVESEIDTATAGIDTNIVNKLGHWNSVEIFNDIVVYPANTTKSGVTLQRNTGGESVHISGTATADSYTDIIAGGQTTIPNGFEAGRTYYVEINNSTGGYRAGVDINLYSASAGRIKTTVWRGPYEFTTPDDLVGVIIQLTLRNGTTYNGDWSMSITNGVPNDIIVDDVRAVTDRTDMFNARDMLKKIIIYPNTEKSGVTFSRCPDNRAVYVKGTSTATATTTLVTGSSTTIPTGFTAGKKYYTSILNGTGVTGEAIGAIIKVYGTSTPTATYNLYSGNSEFTTPDDLKGLTISLYIETGHTFDGEWALAITGDIPNYALEGTGGETYNYEINNYSQTVNVTASPTIETTTDCYLVEAQDPTTDRTAEILAMLQTNKYCKLGKGTFVVSGLVMPDYSRLEGSGIGTILLLPDSVSDGFVVSMKKYCTISDVQISGGDTSYRTSSTIGTRNGILYQGSLNSQGEYVNIPLYDCVHDILIRNFSGSGILCEYTGTKCTASMTANNVWIANCCAGLNISKNSEYSRYTNCKVLYNHYGVINNGGNNSFVNCDITHNYVGVTMDNSDGTATNNSHGQMVGCMINHNGESNDGYAIVVKGMTNGFVFDGCNIYYGDIDIENSNGIVLSNMNCGNVLNITATNCISVLFMGCILGSQPTFVTTGSTSVIAANCYVRSTGAQVTIP